MSVVIKAENISKQYRLGEVGTGSLKDDFKRWRYRMQGKEDPFLTIGEENDRTVKSAANYVWALKDVNFEVNQGDVLGIVGKNGAGKSTLLKILSRTTGPTTGSLKMKGRVASLLEVGTGFHGELSGRENVFLNGAIMGMSKFEIKKKFDEIVDFAGVEKYIDTPVKRYSSGMYVRLAFGVAAHLEPDILIVDEVLAVGDAEFQKKALGKMKDVSNQDGRTVLFVSHNMTAVKNLCSTALYMQHGKVLMQDRTEEVINYYLASTSATSTMVKVFNSPDEAPGNEQIRIKRLEVCPVLENATDPITVNTPIDIEIEFWNFKEGAAINLSLVLYTVNEECVFNVATKSQRLTKGLHKGVCSIPANLLNDNAYSVSMLLVKDRSIPIYIYENAVSFEVNENRKVGGWHGKWIGIVRPQLNFTLE